MSSEESVVDVEARAKSALDGLLDTYSRLVCSQVAIQEQINSLEAELSRLKDLQEKVNNSVHALRGRVR